MFEARKKKINDTLESFFQAQKKELYNNIPLQQLVSLLNASTRGGKYIRGVLVCLGTEIANKPVNEDTFKIAAAYEIIHASLLIHDDVMDQSTMRRGKPSIYAKLGDNQYGTSQAICLGDLGFFLATALINTTQSAMDKKYSLLNHFAKILRETVYGQMLDIYLAKRATASKKDIILMQQLKTAQYSIVGPLQSGMLLGNVTKKQWDSAELFGKNFGIAFQMYDDIIGIFGDPKKKSTSSDIHEGKKTLLFLHAYENASERDKKFLKKYYGNYTTIQQREKIKTIFKDSGALSYAQSEIEKYRAEARIVLPAITDKRNSNQEISKILNKIIPLHIDF